MKTTRSFSLKDRAKSVHYAWQALNAFFDRQHTAIVPLFFTIAVFAAAIFFNVSKTELIALVISAGLVWSAEVFNSAIEEMMDHVSRDYHPRIKYIKDVAAAAVLISVVAAVITGIIIFTPKLF